MAALMLSSISVLTHQAEQTYSKCEHTVNETTSHHVCLPASYFQEVHKCHTVFFLVSHSVQVTRVGKRNRQDVENGREGYKGNQRRVESWCFQSCESNDAISMKQPVTKQNDGMTGMSEAHLDQLTHWLQINDTMLIYTLISLLMCLCLHLF